LKIDLAYATDDKYPVSTVHALIISKRHCCNYFNLTPEETIILLEFSEWG
jgi:diadenosine tetraphosphate (Ap4A) HIT family hydrolase